jgi:putative ATPase
LAVEEGARALLLAAADGDARRMLNLLETAADLSVEQDSGRRLDVDTMRAVIGSTYVRFDKGGENFYDQISALHKSVRGSDPDAALYWLCRMLAGGCDPLYVARRAVRMASEDIGNADPRALTMALEACAVYERLGSPEGELAIAQAIIFMACAAKSNAVYAAFNAATEDATSLGSLEVPLHLRNAPTRLMKEIGYGKGYRYAHDEPGGYAAGERYFPDDMPERRYYVPVARGLEIKIGEALAARRARDAKVPDAVKP